MRIEAGARLPFGLVGVTGAQRSLKIIENSTGVYLSSAGHGIYEGRTRLSDGTGAILYVKFNSGGVVVEIGLTLGETA